MNDLNATFRMLVGMLMKAGKRTSPRGSGTIEIQDVMIRLENPYDRFIMHPAGKLNIAKAIGRVLWELRGAEDEESITYYDPMTAKFAVNGIVPSAYGRRMKYQLRSVVNTLHTDPESRRGSVVVLDLSDNRDTQLEYPCVLSLQFTIRESKLNLQVVMRSQSLWNVFPYDIMIFTVLQEKIAQELGREVGSYTHTMLSCHIYDQDIPKIETYLAHENSENGKAGGIHKPLLVGEKTINVINVIEKSLRTCASLDVFSTIREEICNLPYSEMKQWLIVLYEYKRLKTFFEHGNTLEEHLTYPYNTLMKGSK